MAKHRKISERSVRTRTLVGGFLAGGALAVTGPAGVALAVPTDTGNPSADAVGRAALDNPAPGVRAAQAIGDHVFNQKTPVNKALDNSGLGDVYHLNFGTTSADGITPGKNGVVVGELNVNAGKYYYDQAQKLGAPLPGEKDLPGVVPKVLSGKASAAKPASSATKLSSSCTAATAKTKVSAQAASC